MSIKVIIDNDGNVDDLIAVSLIINSPKYKVTAITVCSGDGYKEASIESVLKFLAYFGQTGILVAGSDYTGIHPFPDDWRQISKKLCDIPALKNLDISKNHKLDDDASDLMVRLLSESQYTLLITGPLTNLSNALRKKPEIKNNIQRIYIMGGAIGVKGNVHEYGHDGSAEWNIYNNAMAASTVLSSNIPITLVPLDACNYVPITKEFLEYVNSIQEYSLLAQSLNIFKSGIESGTYYFWDELTAVVMLDPSCIEITKMRITLDTMGISEGQTHISEKGYEMDVAIKADSAKVLKILLDTFAPVTNK